MHEDKISVIIPVFNAEKYLRKCLESVIKQTHKNLEIILIDDKSKDGSVKICKEYAKKDKRIIFIRNKENLGQAATRNVGLKNASGDYIGFVDNDDWLNEKFFEVLLDNLKKHDVLVSGCATATCYDNGVVKFNRSMVPSGLVDGDDLIKEILYFDPVRWGTVWNKIFDKSLKQDLYFIPHHELEDYYVTIKIFKKYCKSIYFDNRPLYYYYHRDSSQSRRGYHKNITTEIAICNKIRSFLEKTDIEKFRSPLDFFEFNVRYSIIVLMYKNSQEIFFEELRNELEELRKRLKVFKLKLTAHYFKQRLVVCYIRTTKKWKKYKDSSK